MFTLAFLRTNWRELCFGFLMCFLSSPGQTFFISLFGGEIRATFDISDGEFGSIYSLGTLASAAVLVWSGRLADRLRLANMATLALLGLALVCLAMSAVPGPVVLVAVIFGLRQFGQGLVAHTAMTAMARRFDVERGRALSIATLGYTAGEALLPITVVSLLAFVHWRNLWIGAAILLLLMLPVIRFLVAQRRQTPGSAEDAGLPRPRTGMDHTLREVLREPSLWLRLPALLAPSFISTGLFFHQVALAQSKGWPLTLWASAYVVLALSGLISVIVSGPLTDWLSSRRLLAFFLAPLAFACLVLWAGDSAVVAVVFMLFMGLNAGMTFVALGAIWAELYGVKQIGAIKAFGTAASVFSSGLAPGAMGLAMDAGYAIETIALICALYCIGASAVAAIAPEPRKASSQR